MYISPSNAVTIFTAVTLNMLLSISLNLAGGLPAVGAENLVVTVIDQVDVAAIEMGTLKSLSVREGDSVREGQVIGKLDDEQVQLQAELAAAEWTVAAKRAEKHYASALAGKDLLHQEQLANQHEILSDIAKRKAANDLRVQASTKAEGVAANEYLRANKARQRFPDSVSQSELDALRLKLEQSKLDTRQADFERGIDILNAKSEERASELFRVQVDRARLAVQQADADQDIIALQATAKKHAAELAKHSIDRHQIISPLDGVVVQRYEQPGQWVKPGAPVVRVVRLNRLRAEGYVSLNIATPLRKSKNVTLLLSVATQTVKRSGEVVFVSPEVNPIDGRVRVLIEFDNPDEDVLPGTPVQLSLE